MWDATSEDTQLSINGKPVRVRLTAKDRTIPDPKETTSESDRLSPQDRRSIEEAIEKYMGRPKIDPPFDKLPGFAQEGRLCALSKPEHYAADDNEYQAEEFADMYAYTQPIRIHWEESLSSC